MRVTRSAGLPAILIVSIVWLAGGGAAARASSGAGWAVAPRRAIALAARGPSALHDAPAAAPYRGFEGRLSPLEEELFADAADGRLDEHSLLAAALVAGGLDDPERLAAYEARLDALVDELARSGEAAGTDRRKARAVFDFMHRRILRGGYQINASDLASALDDGRFNCVSASVLFNCLAERFGLAARGLEIPGHAMSRLVLADGVLDVETTCPRWFELMNDPKKQAELVEKTTGFRHPEDQGQSADQRREVSCVGLVATIYYNRGVDLLAEGRFADALAANAKALRLDPTNDTARGNLLATLNNWAIGLGRSVRYAEAAALLRQGLELDPDYETFAVNYTHVHHQWAEQLCAAGRFEDALELLARAADDRPGTAYFRQARFDVCRRWAGALLEAGRPDEASSVFAGARQRWGDCPQLAAAQIGAFNDRALRLLEDERYEEALAALDQGLAEHPDSELLRENRRAVVMRWAEPAFHSGDYAEAIRRTTMGATPGHLSEVLVGNVCYGYYQWISGLAARGHRVEAEQVARKALADPFLGDRAASAIPPLAGP